VGGAANLARMAQKDPYSLLGVSKNAGDAEIKRAFRKKARQYHPDRNPDDPQAEAKFKEVQEAYDTIGTAKERNEYEQQQRMSSMFGGGGRSSFGGGGGMDDMLKQMFGGGGMGGGRQRQQRQQPRRQQKGADIKVSLDMTVEQAEQGGRFPFTFKRLKPNQAGTMEATSVTLSTTIKPGVKHGTVNRLRAQGHDHPEGEPGDVLLTVRIQFGEGRYWEQATLVQEVSTPYTTLMLGGKVKVKLPSGKSIMLTIAPESHVGDRRKVPGAGYDGGDLELEFVLPEAEGLSKVQIKALKALRDKGL
jgi:DnaJ-class molecular chaperone